ncbi:hypothetical protein PUN28_019528 [Cardiocondyla obscurior]|uniref:Translation elongation factor EF1B beta/delta subunit guanine nucleotide exchange domain-containing protein n=1 Tax=Cardiocondyla obscurior TaxID=286306 RepID=A0AAW2EBQ4_9HYME
MRKLLFQVDGIAAYVDQVTPRIINLEKDNQELRSLIQGIKDTVESMVQRIKSVDSLQERVESLEMRVPYIAICPAKPEEPEQKLSKEKDDNEDIDLFDSDSEAKPAVIAKSNIILDVKPWDDETNMREMEKAVRKIQIDGLFWGTSKLVPLAFGIHKLQISCVVEDDKVSVDWLTEQIQDLEDYVQSVDIAAFNKV